MNAVTLEQFRAFCADRQEMGGALAGGDARSVIARTGWLRSVGGSNPYLALRDRAGLSREAIDRAVATIEIQELPSARGCTYVVPKDDFALALSAAGGSKETAEVTAAKKHLGVTDKELDRLAARVLGAVKAAPLDPKAIKDAVGDAVRSLGAEGKKRGVSTTLPLVLGQLQARGELRRVPIDGRLDQQRYRYAAWTPSPLASTSMTQDVVARELARRFFRWAAPATLAEFATWSGLGMKASRAAIDDMGLVPVAIEDGGERLASPEDRDRLLAFDVPRAPRISFVSSLDNLLHLRRDVRAHVSAEDAARKMPGGAAKDLVGSIADLAYHPIVDRGRIVGLWDWDGMSGELAWATFGKTSKAIRDAASALAKEVLKDLGDVRSFSLDSPESRVDRLAALRNVRW